MRVKYLNAIFKTFRQYVSDGSIESEALLETISTLLFTAIVYVVPDYTQLTSQPLQT